MVADAACAIDAARRLIHCAALHVRVSVLIEDRMEGRVVLVVAAHTHKVLQETPTGAYLADIRECVLGKGSAHTVRGRTLKLP